MSQKFKIEINNKKKQQKNPGTRNKNNEKPL